eukprot:TRINITY_DN3136_c1_g3_i2.p1 TRINITY_DN3136_c1_g3~~TRINITY_DN3136_c1_g3_i2.p1  ORF type:complete len:333 (-),score=38.24 TRINITY_DN3136_c1_g3_i2:387-1241(-)
MPYLLEMIYNLSKARFWDDKICGDFIDKIIEYKEFLKVPKYGKLIKNCLEFDVDERTKNNLKLLIQDLRIYGLLELTPSQLIQLVWCATAINEKNTKFWELVDNQFKIINFDQVNDTKLKLLYQAAILQQINQFQPENQFFSKLPENVQQKCLQLSVKGKAKRSQFQKQVYRRLGSLCQRPGLEATTEDGQMGVDISIINREKNQKIAIEIDGPTHYTINQPYKSLLRTIFRNQKLELKGWHVICVPFYEWEEFGYNAERKDQYLKNKLGRFFKSDAQRVAQSV